MSLPLLENSLPFYSESISTYENTNNISTKPPLSEKNNLNDLNGKEWVEFTKSWFIENPPPRKKHTLLHPAKFPESLVVKFLKFFTKSSSRHVILDPFAGTSSVGVAIDMINQETQGNRVGYCIELNEKYAQISKNRTSQKIINADSLSYNYDNIPDVDFLISSPPYWNVLHKDTGYIQKQRKSDGLDTIYSSHPQDLGNIQSYDEFIETLSSFFARLSEKLKKKKFCVIVLSSTNRGGKFFPIPYDFARELENKSKLVWKGEKIWCQDNKALMPYGYPYSFVPNFTHHSCLIFRKES